MNWRAIRAIVLKDLAVVRQSRALMLPLIIVPAIMFVVLPLLASFAPALINVPGAGDMLELLERMPPGLQESLAGFDQEQQLFVFMVVYMLAPFFLITPLMVANVIAADSFAGEKERKTLEALLYTPVTDRELVTAKLLAPWLAAMVVSVLGFVLYAVVVNLSGWRIMGEVFFPTPMWIVLLLWVAPAVAAFGLAGAVIVSLRVSTVQEAYQLGGVVVLPIVILLVSQATGLLYFSIGVVALLGAAVWLVDLALLWTGVRNFDRSRLVRQV